MGGLMINIIQEFFYVFFYVLFYYRTVQCTVRPEHVRRNAGKEHGPNKRLALISQAIVLYN